MNERPILLRPRALWASALGLSVLLSTFAAFRGGYVGPDYWTHMPRLIGSTRVLDFSGMDAPAYFLLSHALFLLVGKNNALPITLSIIQAAINALAMWWFFVYSERRFKSPVLHLAFVFFLVFLPVRIIHATVVGADWMTVPLFVLILFLFDKFLRDETSTAKTAAFLGWVLAIAVWSKYSFAALLPALFLIFTFLWRKRRWDFKRFGTICALSFLVPSALLLYTFWASARVQGLSTHGTWLKKGETPEMNYKDLFSLKANDAQLLRAPEYFRAPEYRAPQYFEQFDIRVPHKHSYLALSHLAVFTDPMNVFQELPLPDHFDESRNPGRTRRLWKTPVMAASISLGVLWTVLALIGTPWILFGAFKNLFRDKLEREDAMAFLGTAYFLLMFLPIPFVSSGCLYGYWTPRLILPALLYFFLAGFLLLDRKIVRESRRLAFSVLVLVIVQSAIEIVMLA
jgi:4-amino-4-deoxy-L-arabinose transferase-like glycosyltransferase